MPDSFSQSNRIGSIKTPFGDDQLVLTKFDGTEGVSQLFEFHAEGISSQADLDFDSAIGKDITVTLQTIGQGPRYFCGTLTDGGLVGAVPTPRENVYLYKLTLRPALWMAGKRTNSKIFPNKTVTTIITEVLGDYGISPDNKCEQSFSPIEYCVQHRETDLDFVSRLMERYGIAYHFEFSDGNQKMVIGDSMSAYNPVPGSTRPFLPYADEHNADVEHLTGWVPRRAFTTGTSTINAYDFKKPSADLKSEQQGDAGYEHGQLERYVHQNKYTEKSDGDSFSTHIKVANRSEDFHFTAEGDAASMVPGSLMTLQQHPDSAQNKEYLLLRATHEYADESYFSGGPANDGPPYHGTYEFVASDKPYAPPQSTELPRISGPQTAKVVGDGEIDCDEYGRILVQFHWDQYKDKSMRCRVAQVWAGSQWGGMFIPRVGMEVLVHFIDGDPDHPMVIGCVYNADNKPPYPLDGKKNIAGWKSNSTEGGGGYNEFIMDDTKGNELVRAHAQFNLDSTVENDETRHVKVDRTTKIDNNETMNVGNEIMITAQTKITIKCGQSTIVMDPTSITIQSLTINVLANAELNTNGKATANHTSDGKLSVQAPMVTIN